MKTLTTSTPSSEDRFRSALASVLAADPAEMKERLAQAKNEKPSPHTKYTYVPVEDQP